MCSALPENRIVVVLSYSLRLIGPYDGVLRYYIKLIILTDIPILFTPGEVRDLSTVAYGHNQTVEWSWHIPHVLSFICPWSKIVRRMGVHCRPCVLTQVAFSVISARMSRALVTEECGLCEGDG